MRTAAGCLSCPDRTAACPARLSRRRDHGRAVTTSMTVLRYLAQAGWVVPDPVGELVRCEDRWYCLTRYVPGQAVTEEDAGQQRRRGRDLARLHLALRGLAERLGQRAGWRAQHQGVTLQTDLDWTACVRGAGAKSVRGLAPGRGRDWADAGGAGRDWRRCPAGHGRPRRLRAVERALSARPARWRDRLRPDPPGQPGPTSSRSRAPGGHRQRSMPTAASWPGLAGRSATLKKRRSSRSITPSGSTRSPGRSPTACGRASSTWP